MKYDTLQKNGSQNVSVVRSFQYGLQVFEDSFENFLIKMFNKEVFESFKASHPSDYNNMKNDIRLKIKTCSEDKERISLKIPFTLIEMYQNKTGERIKETICKFKDLQIIGDKLRLPLSLVIEIDLLKKPTSGVFSGIEEELETQNNNRIIVFGQLAQSPIIQKELKSICQNVIVLSETNILSGAVIVGKRYTAGQIITLAPRAYTVAAIDIGTTYSGWAVSFYSTFKSDPANIYAHHWNSGSYLTVKTPTSLLVKPDGKTIEAFGYEAENMYMQLIENESHADYYFFHRFKMLLYKELSGKINRTIMIQDETNKELPAMDVFKMSIKYLSDSLLKQFNERFIGEDIKIQDIHWVLTVPAIWSDGAKQFMREAAVKAGIDSRTLSIALEPEVASIYCRHQKINKIAASTNDMMGKDISCLEEGKRYMIIDAGGGTVDITVHEVGTNGSIKEVHAACGGSWGGTAVDKAFESVLLELLGKSTFAKFKEEHLEDYFNVWRAFEFKKRLFKPSNDQLTALFEPSVDQRTVFVPTSDQPTVFKSTSDGTSDKSNVCLTKIDIPLSLLDFFKEATNEDLSNSIAKSHHAKEIKLKGNKMTISADMMMSFFTHSIMKIILIVQKILLECKHVSAILMVGGYSESIVLQNAVKYNFPGMETIVPIEASCSIMKGAVIFGFRPAIISKRVLKKTYGVRSVVSFIKGKHPENKRLQTDAGDMCTDIFIKHVEKDQEVNFGEAQVRKIYTPVYKGQKRMRISVYASEKANPVYTDQDCHFVGQMIIELSEAETLDKEIEVALSFSHTEIVVVAKTKETGKETHASFDFLCEDSVPT